MANHTEPLRCPPAVLDSLIPNKSIPFAFKRDRPLYFADNQKGVLVQLLEPAGIFTMCLVRLVDESGEEVICYFQGLVNDQNNSLELESFTVITHENEEDASAVMDNFYYIYSQKGAAHHIKELTVQEFNQLSLKT